MAGPWLGLSHTERGEVVSQFHSLIYIRTMDFVERLFGLSPDGGSGMFEALILCVLIAVVGMLARKAWASMRRST